MSDRGSANPSRIAIKFGAAPSTSSNHKRPSWPPPPSTLGKRPRRHALGEDSESDEEHANGKHERITGFGVSGAETASSRPGRKPEPAAPLAIERQANRDWRAEVKSRRAGKDSRRQETDARQNGDRRDVEPADEEKPMTWGLTVKRKPSREDMPRARGEDTETSKEMDDPTLQETARDRTGEGTGTAGLPDADKEAIDSLLGKSVSAKGDLVIERGRDRFTEDDAFRRDFRDAPDESTLDEYETMPIDEFGAALLRGMGWDGKDRGPKIKEVKRRPNQLGLGAKELKGDEELGAWNQKGNTKSRPRLHEHRSEEQRQRERRNERHRDSYKAERDREKRESGRSEHRYRDRHHRR